MNIFSQTQISGISSCEWSILAVSIAKFGLLMQGTNQNAPFDHGPVQLYDKGNL